MKINPGYASGGSKVVAPGAPIPPGHHGPKFAQFHAGYFSSFLEILAESYVGAPGGPVPPPAGNPGPVPLYCAEFFTIAKGLIKVLII